MRSVYNNRSSVRTAAVSKTLDTVLDTAFKIQQRKPPIVGMPNITWHNDGSGDFYVDIDGDKDRGFYAQVLEDGWSLSTNDSQLKRLPKFLYADIFEGNDGRMYASDANSVIKAIAQLEEQILDLLM